MNNFIKNFIATPIMVLGLVVGSFAMFAQIADAAVTWDSNYNLLGVENFTNNPGGTNWSSNTSADAQDLVAFLVTLNNTGSTPATNVKIKLSPETSSADTNHNFTLTVTANGQSWNDSVSVNLSQSLAVEPLYTAKKYNNLTQFVGYLNASDLYGSGISLGTINPGNANGITVQIGYRVDNQIITPPYNLDVYTGSADNIAEDSARLEGETNGYGSSVEVWFEYATSSGYLSVNGNGILGATMTSPDTQNSYNGWLPYAKNINGLQNNTTYYYQICGDNGDVIECDSNRSFTTTGSQPVDVCPLLPGLQTSIPNGYEMQNGQCVPIIIPNESVVTIGATGVDEDSATLQGAVTGGNNIDTWFVITDNTSNPSCSTINYQEVVNGLYDAGDLFDVDVYGLQEDTTYYYRACSTNDDGVVLNFDTNDSGNGQNPDATTNNEDDVDEDSAELNGEIDMNSYNNGIVFFVYGQDESRIDDVENDYDEYSDVDNDEDQDDFMNELMTSNFNGSSNFSETVNNLDEGKEYFFRICVEYDDNNNNETLECGSVKNFDTNTQDGDEPEVETENPSNIEEDSARLNGSYDLNDFDDADIFFAWSDNNNDLDDIEDEDQITDVDNYANVEIVEYNADGSDNNVEETINNLEEDTRYYYRLCALYEDEDGDDVIECGNVESFTTDGGYNPPQDNDRPIPGVCAVSNIGVGSATMSARVDGNGNSTSSYFQYGRTTSFGSNTSTSSTGSNTNIVSKFVSGLSVNTTYYCRIVSENTDGISYGDIGTFRTGTLNIITPVPNTPVTIISSGAGAPIFLEIDDEQEMAVRGQTLPYDVRWENISGRDLDEVVLNVRLPKSVRFVSSTKGRYNKRDHNVTVSIGELEAGEEDDMVIFAVVRGGTEGDQLVAEATIAFEDPQGETRGLLATIEYDVDTYTNGANGLLAGLFGIGFLPGIIGLLLAILLILIIVLVARRVTEPRHTEYRG